MAETLNAEEVNVLMNAINDGRVPAETTPNARGPVIAYDLTSQDKIIRGQMPTLDSINEQIASQIGIGLTGRTRLNLRATSQTATLQKFAEFYGTFDPACAVAVVSMGPAYGYGLTVLRPGLPESLLAAALGDRKVGATPPAADAPRKDLTAVEQMVLKRLLTILMDSVARCWAQVVPFKPEVVRFESDFRLAMVAPPSDLAIVNSYDISGALEGKIQLVIPYSAVESVKARLAAPPRMAIGSDERFLATLSQELEKVHVELRGQLGRTTVRFAKLLELKEGDVLTLSSDESSPIPIFVQGRHKLNGTPRVANGSLALAIDGRVGASPNGNGTGNHGSEEQ